jgi:eukaryotic-like serine/threonine-protein kinase
MAQLQPGTLLQNTYRVIRRIGQGGMGQVYEVEHARLSNRYALKLLGHEASADPEFLQRFRREAQIVSSLRHPHIVQVVDFDESPDGRPYLVMELIEGEELAARVEREGALPLPAVVAIVNQMAAALQTAHDLGVIHRDLKPENILLMRVGQGAQPEFAKLVDFGVSKVKSDVTRLTQKRTMLGTPHYMSPEQALAQEVDERADQFALAAITYELLSGELAFAGDTVPAVVFQVAHGEPPRLEQPGGWISPEVDRVLKRALAKQASDRFVTVTEFASAFERAANGVAEDGLARARRPLANTTRRVRQRVVSVTRPIQGGRRLIAAAVVGGAALGVLWAVTRGNRSREIGMPAAASAPTAAVPPIPAPAPPETAVTPTAVAPAAAQPAAAPASTAGDRDARRSPPRRPATARPEDRLYNEL